MDKIFLRGVEMETWLGVFEWERQMAQRVKLDLDIFLPKKTAAASDNLNDTIDYARVVLRLREHFATQQFALIEALAEAVAALILAEFSAAKVRVSLTKLGILSSVAAVGIEIERENAS